MVLAAHSSGLAGEPNDWGWAQFYEFNQEEHFQTGVEERVFAVVGVNTVGASEGGGREELVLLGKDLASALRERCYSKGFGDSILKNLKDIISMTVQVAPKGKKVQIGIVVQKENFVYLVCYGGARIYLSRQGLFVPIVKSKEEETISASGHVRSGDTLLLGTKSFFEEFEGGVLKAALESKNARKLAEYFVPMVHSKENSGDMAMLALNFTGEPFDVRNSSKEEVGLGVQRSVFPKGLREKLGNFLKKSVYVKGGEKEKEFSKKRKVSASVGILLLFILIISIFFGIKQKKKLDFKKSYEQELVSARHSLEESKDLQNLDPERARELFLDARGKVLGLSVEIDDPEVLALKKEVEERQGEILGEYSKSAELFVDLGLLSDGFEGTDLVLTQGFIYVLDSSSKRVIKISVSSKRAEVVAGPSKIDEALGLAAYLDKCYVLNSRGIFDISNSDLRKVIENTWQGEVLPYSYASNIYVLEKSMSRIWRYAGNGDGFGEGKEWLSAGTSVELGSAISWTIDGNIWILTKGGDIYRFALGNLQRFSLSGDFTNGASFDYIYTSDELDNLYLLDRSNKRVLVFDKDGKYQAQYINDAISETMQAVVSEKEGKIILLDKNKLYSIDLSAQ